MIVLDANILIRAVLGRSVRTFLDEYSARGVHFFAPDVAFQDAAKYLPLVLSKLAATLQYLQEIVEITDRDL